jgi:hypothetical protein
MASEAAVILLEDHIASSAGSKLETVSWLTDKLLGDPSLRKELLAQATMIHSDTARENFLQCFGVESMPAKVIDELLDEWIPQEITHPTAESSADVSAADKILTFCLKSVDKSIGELAQSIETWQVDKEIDMLADLGSELETVFKDLGLAPLGPKNGSALGKAVEAHIEHVEHDRTVDGLVETGITVISLFAFGGPLVALAGALPSLLASQQRLDDLQLLQGLGSADTEAVAEAEVNFAKSCLALAASLAVGSAIP